MITPGLGPGAAMYIYENGLSEKGDENGLSGWLSPEPLLLPGGCGGAAVIMTREMELSSSIRITSGLTYLLFFSLIEYLLLRLKYNLFDPYTTEHLSTADIPLFTITVIWPVLFSPDISFALSLPPLSGGLRYPVPGIP